MADTKTSALSAATALDGTELVPVVQSSTSKKATAAQVSVADLYRLQPRRPQWFSDFLGTANSVISPFVGTAISTGTLAAANATAAHPGIARITSSTSANSGFRIVTDPSSLLMSAGDVFEAAFTVITTSNTTVRIGFVDTTSVTDVSDGVYAEIIGTTLSFKSASGGTRTTAGSTYTITASTWYRMRAEMRATADVRVTLFDDAGTAVLAEQTITTNLPTSGSHYTGVGIVATNSGTSAVDLADVDYLSYERKVGTELTR